MENEFRKWNNIIPSSKSIIIRRITIKIEKGGYKAFIKVIL